MSDNLEDILLRDMYNDSYYPTFLVDKIKDELEELIEYLEEEDLSLEDIQDKLDEVTIAINNLEEEFESNDSEIETVARDSIGESIEEILKYYNIDIDIETAIRERDW